MEQPSVYCEAIEPAGTAAKKPPMFLVHGGAHTGACYLATADGRPGWAHIFAAAGHRVLIPDWPGSGRSGYIHDKDLTGEVVVAGLAKALNAVGEPAIVVVHSMSGAYGWKLLEQYGDRIAMLVAIAPAPPGNIQREAIIRDETIDAVLVATGDKERTLSKTEPYKVNLAYVVSKFVGSSSRFPKRYLTRYANSLQPIASRLLYERANVAGSQMKVRDFSHYAGKRVLIITGTDDTDHPRWLDATIVQWLNDHGAAADFWFLGDHGIFGNGHMLMLEQNSDAIAALILSWIANTSVSGAQIARRRHGG